MLCTRQILKTLRYSIGEFPDKACVIFSSELVDLVSNIFSDACCIFQNKSLFQIYFFSDYALLFSFYFSISSCKSSN